MLKGKTNTLSHLDRADLKNLEIEIFRSISIQSNKQTLPVQR